MHAIETSMLTKNYGNFTAVSDLNISVEFGEIFGMLGPNGAGKTTTVKMLTTLLPPTRGRALISDFDITKEKNKVRKIIGYLPQQLTSDDTLTGYENLLFYAKLYGQRKAERESRIEEALELVGLTDAARAMVTTYSGGMKRRLELASVFVNRPQILFLDEPTLGLDPISRNLIWTFIRKLRETIGTTIFITTNYMDEADNLCDRVAIVDSGKIVVDGSPSNLKASLGGEVITLNGTNANEQQLEMLMPYVERVEKVGESLKLYVKPMSESAIRFFRKFLDDLDSNGINVSSVTIERPSLDDVFISFVHRSLAGEPAMAGPKKMNERAWIQKASRF